ncbi:MAG: helix-turn-helix domain-containing protein [Thermomicrobiales bacterium]
MEKEHEMTTHGAGSYQRWRERLRAQPEYQAVYAEEAAKSELWLQLVEARQQAGLTQKQLAERLGVSQAQVARIEKRGYDAYTLTSLRRYVAALGDDFSLAVQVRHHDKPVDASLPLVIATP